MRDTYGGMASNGYVSDGVAALQILESHAPKVI